MFFRLLDILCGVFSSKYSVLNTKLISCPWLYTYFVQLDFTPTFQIPFRKRLCHVSNNEPSFNSGLPLKLLHWDRPQSQLDKDIPHVGCQLKTFFFFFFLQKQWILSKASIMGWPSYYKLYAFDLWQCREKVSTLFVFVIVSFTFYKPEGNTLIVYQSKFHYHSQNLFLQAHNGHTPATTLSLAFWKQP